MYYILFNGLTPQDKEEIVNAIVANGYVNSRFGPQENAIGVCTTTRHPMDKHGVYTFLSDIMCSDNPHTSWTYYRTQCYTKEDFINKIKVSK